MHIVRKEREAGKEKREVFTTNKGKVAMLGMTGRTLVTISSLT